MTIFSSPNVAVSVTKWPENRGHKPSNGVFRAENDMLKLSSSSPIEMMVVDFFRFMTDPFWVIFGHFGSKVTILWARDLGARGTPPPNFNMGFVYGTQGRPGWGRVRAALGRGEPWFFLIGHWDTLLSGLALGPRRASEPRSTQVSGWGRVRLA